MKPFIEVMHPQSNCPIYFEDHSKVKKLIKTKEIVILTDHHVEPLYGKALQQSLGCSLISMPAGEKNKNGATKERLEKEMFALHLKRDTTLIALGGGTVTDMGGFIASTYCRGIPLILIPTTLLGMVDASIGGKNGINNRFGKNLIGTFYPPQEILIDPQLLYTLPPNEMANGMMETVKHALIGDAVLFSDLESSREPFIERSIAVKAKIVSEDPLERGKRRLLNFGHTVGHAIEAASKYTIPHGEAIALGMRIEADLSKKYFGLCASECTRIHTLVNRYFPHASPFSFEELLPFMKHDKKNTLNAPRFVALSSIGIPHTFNENYCSEID